MDEPLSNLDALLRLQMRAELKRLHREIGTTTVYVTHDQIEALSLGDRIAVMREGEIVQLDTPNEVYDKPANVFVGGFIGTPPMNFLKAKVLADDKDVFLAIGDFQLEVPDVWKAHLREMADKTVILGIRAENIEVHPETNGGRLPANVIVAEPLGSQQLLTVQVGDDVLKVATKPDLSVQPGHAIGLALVKDKIRIFDVQTGAAITFP